MKINIFHENHERFAGTARAIRRSPVVAAVFGLMLSLALAAADLDLRPVIDWPGYFRSPAVAIAVTEKHAFLAEHAGVLSIYEISDLSRPQRVGGFHANARGMALSGQHLYLCGSRLEVVDVSQPLAPRRVGSVTLSNGAEAITIVGKYAYLAAVRGGPRDRGRMQIVNIETPDRPKPTGHYDTDGEIRSIAIMGNYALVAEMPAWDAAKGGNVGGGLLVLDVSDPASPRRVAGVAGIGSSKGVAVNGNVAYLAESPRWSNNTSVGGGLRVIDFSDPLNPKPIGGYVVPIQGSVDSVASVGVSAGRLFLTNPSGDWPPRSRLQVFDVGDPKNPQPVGSHFVNGDIGAVAVREEYGFLTRRETDENTGNQSDRLEVLDIRTLGSVELLGRMQTAPWEAGRVVVGAGYAYVLESRPSVVDPPQAAESRLEILDVRDPSNPRTARVMEGSFSQLALAGSSLFLAKEKRIERFDVSSPANPRLTGVYTGGSEVKSIAVSQEYAVVGTEDETLVLDLRAPDNLPVTGSLPIRTTGGGIEIAGGLVYVAGWLEEDGARVYIVDISNPAGPKRLGSYLPPHGPTTVRLVANHLFVRVWVPLLKSYLIVLDVSDPTAPTEVANYSNISFTEVNGGLLYMVHSDGLDLYDISRPPGLELVNHVDLDGPVSDIEVSGDLAFVAGPAGVQILELRKPTSSLVSRLPTTGEARDIAVLGNQVYLADGHSGLRVFDALGQDPAQQIGSWFRGDAVTQVETQDGRAYIVEGGGNQGSPGARLSILSVRNPAAPERIGSLQLNFPVRKLRVVGDYAYLAEGEYSGPSRLEIIDCTDPRRPKAAGACTTMQAGSLAVSGDYAYIAPGGNGISYIQLVNVNNPAQPLAVAPFLTKNPAQSIGVSGNYAYVTSNAGLEVYDVSAAPALRLVGRSEGIAAGWRDSIEVPGRIAVAGNSVIDISDPVRPTVAAVFRGFNEAFAVAHGRLYAASGGSGFQVLEMNLANPQHFGARETADRESPVAVATSGNYAFVAARNGGMPVFDFSNPASPQRVAHYDTKGRWVERVVVSGDYAWLSLQTDPQRLEILGITNPLKPERLGQFEFRGWASPPALIGTRACVVDRSTTSRLLVLDVSDPANPKQIGECELSGEAWAVAAKADLAFVVGPTTGLQVIDLSDPGRPRPIGRYASGGEPVGIVIKESLAFVADRELGLVVLDVRDPTNPVRIGNCHTGSRPERLALHGDYLYLVGWGSGVDVIDVRNPLDPRRVGGTSLMEAYDVALAPNGVIVPGGGKVWILDRFHPASTLRAASAATTDGFRLQLQLGEDRTYRVQRSSNLKDWQDWKVVTKQNPSTGLILDSEPAPHRFYRLQLNTE